MRTIIAGSRSIANLFCPNGIKLCDDDCNCHQLAYEYICTVLNDECPWQITTVISGTARGVDIMGEQWGRENDVPIERYPADWTKYGKSAGPKRNIQMAEEAEACVVFYDGESRGSKHMIETAKKYDLGLMTHIPQQFEIDHWLTQRDFDN